MTTNVRPLTATARVGCRSRTSQIGWPGGGCTQHPSPRDGFCRALPCGLPLDSALRALCDLPVGRHSALARPCPASVPAQRLLLRPQRGLWHARQVPHAQSGSLPQHAESWSLSGERRAGDGSCRAGTCCATAARARTRCWTGTRPRASCSCAASRCACWATAGARWACWPAAGPAGPRWAALSAPPASSVPPVLLQCGASRTVAAIKAGFVARTTRRPKV